MKEKLVRNIEFVTLLTVRGTLILKVKNKNLVNVIIVK